MIKTFSNSALLFLIFFICYAIHTSKDVLIIPEWLVITGMILSAILYTILDTLAYITKER